MLTSEKYLMMSDIHIPDQDNKTLALVMSFILDFKPDHIYLLGDQVNFSKISKFEQDPTYHVGLVEELRLAKKFLETLVKLAKKANNNAEVVWFDGNHEDRLMHYLARNAAEIAELNLDDEYLLSIPHLLELKKLGIKYVPYKESIRKEGVVFMHGCVVRNKSGYTGHAYIDKFGACGFTGHTHKVAYNPKTQLGEVKWWIETGCLCNLTPTPRYTTNPDWQQGFATAVYSKETKQFYPSPIQIENHSFMYDGKIYA